MYSIACLSLCISARLSKKSKFLNFCTCYLWPWFDAPLTMRYVMYFRFCGLVDDVFLSNNSERQRVCFVEFVRWRHRERSLSSQTAACFPGILTSEYTFVFR